MALISDDSDAHLWTSSVNVELLTGIHCSKHTVVMAHLLMQMHLRMLLQHEVETEPSSGSVQRMRHQMCVN